jgi:dCTP deaminase
MTLSKEQILDRLNKVNKQNPIIVTPILNKEEQIGPCGIDLRLGKQFIIFNENNQGIFSLNSPKEEIEDYYDEFIVAIGSAIVIHPGKVVVASTLEYVSIPLNLECQVEGRSSWARLGLVIATATTIEPGYKGTITLEISNIGKIPITLFPGLRIAQLIFHDLSSITSDQYDFTSAKKYRCNIGPRPSKILDDNDIKYFCRK